MSECACKIIWEGDRRYIEYCPLHAAAEKLRDALVKAHYELAGVRAATGVPRHYDGVKFGVDEAYFSSVVDECRDAIAAAQGKP